MNSSLTVTDFLSRYPTHVAERALQLREVIRAALPTIKEEVDESAKMIAYSYGTSYRDLICVLIPSQKGLKLGFNRGTQLADPHQLLEGSGKISRYVVIDPELGITTPAITQLLNAALQLYRQLPPPTKPTQRSQS